MPARATTYFELTAEHGIGALTSAVRAHGPPLILGGGSNVLFAGDPKGLVVRCMLGGLESRASGDGEAEVVAGAAVAWDRLVAFCTERGWGGLENLSLIPGSVGGAPVQNVGAYGVELSSSLRWIDALDLDTGEVYRLDGAGCGLGYRWSHFKEDWRDRYLILRVAVAVGRDQPVVDSYPSLRTELDDRGIWRPTPAEIRSTVIAIRRRRLPDPALVGNAGSFFKNAVVAADRLAALRARDPEIPVHRVDASCFRVPTAWMVERCGWKGTRRGAAAVSPDHALVLINTGRATAAEILALALEIESSVHARFGLHLEREVRVVGQSA